MKLARLTLITSLVIFSVQAIAKESNPSFDQQIREFVQNIIKDNNKHVNDIEKENFSILAEGQNPRATVVACSDSRLQTKAFNQTPVNDLFFIRNIGNQIKSAEGSVEYGINHLHTPVLLIIGHSHCGAIKAALGDYSQESAAIRQELDHLHLPKSTEWNKGVVENVHQQVDYALKKFSKKIANKELLVIGAIYDFSDDYHQGHGRLIMVNLNGEHDAAKIKANPLMKGLEAHVLD